MVNDEKPLHRAAERGDTYALGILLKRGWDPNCVDREQRTPLHRAAGSACGKSVSLLLDAGAMVGRRELCGATPLLEAAGSGADDCVARLLEAGAIPSASDKLRSQPIHWAVRTMERSESIRLLFSLGADPNAQDCANQTPLHKLALFRPNAFGILDQVIADPRCDCTIVDSCGQTAEAIARDKNERDFVEALHRFPLRDKLRAALGLRE